MRYNNKFRMRDLFLNSQLSNVFPQFDKQYHSYLEIERKALEYLKSILNGKITSKNQLTVKGKHNDILQRVRNLQALIEGFFNNTSAIEYGIRNNSKLYLPYISLKQIAELDTIEKKQSALQDVLDNILYNPEFQGQNFKPATLAYLKRQNEWKKKVSYKE